MNLRHILIMLVFAVLTSVSNAADAKARFICEFWTIEVTLPNGKTANMLVQTSRETSFVDRSLLQDNSASQSLVVNIGGETLPSIEFEVGEVQGYFQDAQGSIQGFLGRDALRSIVLGLDPSKRTWRVWRTSDYKPEFVAQVFPNNERTEVIDLEYSSRFEPFMRLKLGGEMRTLLVDPGSTWSYIKPKTLSSLNTIHMRSQKLSDSLRTELSLVTDLQGARLSTLLAGNRSTEEVSAELDGVLSIYDLLCDKYILDYKNKRLILDKPTTLEMGGRLLSRITGIPLRLEEKGLFVGNYDRYPVSAAFLQFVGYEVTTLGEMLRSEVRNGLDTWVKGGKFEDHFLKRLGSETSSTFRLGLVKEGTSTSLNIERRGS